MSPFSLSILSVSVGKRGRVTRLSFHLIKMKDVVLAVPWGVAIAAGYGDLCNAQCRINLF